MKKSILWCISLIIICLSYQKTWSQAENFNTYDSTLVDEYYINDVVVTANKINEKLPDVSASVSTVSGLKIKEEEVNTLNDLTFMLPGFHMPDYGTSLTSPIYIRGIGSKINEPAVGLYVDDIPYFEKAAFDFNLFDIERIEVLRGPQGTLYGRNSLGGIIKIYTEEVHHRPTTNFSLGIGNHNRKTYHLKQHIPITNDLITSISGNYMNHHGYYTNQFEQSSIGGKEDLSGRVKLHYDPAENTDLEFILDAKNTQNNGYPYATLQNEGNGKTINYNHNSYYKRKILSSGLKASMDMNDYTLSTVSSYQLLDDFQDVDQDFTPAQLVYVNQDRKHHMFAQEINFSGPQNKKLNLIAGLFGFYQLRNKKVDVFYGKDAVPLFRLPSEMQKIKTYDKTTGGFAAYGQISYRDFVIPDLKATAGLRYDYEFNELDYQYHISRNNEKQLQNEFLHTKSYPELLPKFSLHYQWNNQLVQYFSFTKGYKSGGFNSTFERAEDQTFQPEYSLNYETGWKWSGDRIFAIVAFYHIEVRNKQVYQIDTVSHGPLLKNAARASSRGAELELNHRMLKNWANYLTFGYTHAKYDRYIKNPAKDIRFNGNFIPYIPRYTFSAGSNYRLVMPGGIARELRFHISYHGIGKHFWDDENNMKEDYYGLLNFRLTGVFNRLSCTLWAKNVLNTDYNVFMFESFSNIYSQRNAPLRFGLTVSSDLNIPNLLNF